MPAHLRVARPTDKLESIVEMYRTGLELEVLGSFDGHDGFDGVMLGRHGSDYHLEFTREHGRTVAKPPTPENLLVFYVPELESWEASCARMVEAGFEIVPSHNPYWDARGRTFEDPDGYRVVLQRADWPVGR